MSDKFRNKYRIPSARYPHHDYDGGAYFVTICTTGMEHYFGKISDGEMNYTAIGLFAVEQIEKTTQLRKGEAEIPVFVVMPNHIHLIVFIDPPRRDAPSASLKDIDQTEKHTGNAFDAIQKYPQIMGDEHSGDAFDASLRVHGNKFGPQKRNLSAIIRGFKSAVKSYANQHNIPFSWQPRYHDRIIRNQNEMNRMAEYIENNIIHWKLDEYC